MNFISCYISRENITLHIIKMSLIPSSSKVTLLFVYAIESFSVSVGGRKVCVFEPKRKTSQIWSPAGTDKSKRIKKLKMSFCRIKQIPTNDILNVKSFWRLGHLWLSKILRFIDLTMSNWS